jgi:hypothetical protein
VPIGAGCGVGDGWSCASYRFETRNDPSEIAVFGPYVPPFGRRFRTCPCVARKVVTLAQRIVETLIGRLITDEQFRSEFLQHPETTLMALSDRGLELSRTEIAALVNTDLTLWARTADAIDPRLQKASLKNRN